MILSQAREIEGVKIFRYEGPIFFATCEKFRERLLNSIHLNFYASNISIQTKSEKEDNHPEVLEMGEYAKEHCFQSHFYDPRNLKSL